MMDCSQILTNKSLAIASVFFAVLIYSCYRIGKLSGRMSQQKKMAALSEEIDALKYNRDRLNSILTRRTSQHEWDLDSINRGLQTITSYAAAYDEMCHAFQAAFFVVTTICDQGANAGIDFHPLAKKKMDEIKVILPECITGHACAERKAWQTLHLDLAKPDKKGADQCSTLDANIARS